MPFTPQSTARLHVIDHAAGEGEDLRSEIALYDFFDGSGVARRNHGHAGFDAVHARFGQPFGDADLVVFGEDDAGLLLAVAQRNVVKLDLLGEMELLTDGLGKFHGLTNHLSVFQGSRDMMIFLPQKVIAVQRADFSASGLTGLRGACPLSTRTTSSAALVCRSASDSSE